MATVQVTRIRMSAGGSRHEHITHVGSTTEVWTRETVIAWIDGGAHSFFVQAGGLRANIGVVNAVPKYLRTHADGQ